MNDMVLIAGGIIAIVVIAGGGGWLYRTAFKRGASKQVVATVAEVAKKAPKAT